MDTHHNSQKTVLINVFVNFAFTTMKVPHYFKQSFEHKRAQLLFGEHGVDGLTAEWLDLAIDYTFNAGRARVMHAAKGGNRAQHYSVSKRDFVL